jgi:hypothetical protein
MMLWQLYARKDRASVRESLVAESTALLLKSTLRTRTFEPVVAMLEASKTIIAIIIATV